MLSSAAVKVVTPFFVAPGSRGSQRALALAAGGVAALLALATAGCGDGLGPSLQRLAEAHRHLAELRADVKQTSAASNLAVMAESDEASVDFAREANTAAEAALRDSAALAPLLASLGYSEEGRLLAEFDTRFAEYRALDREVLGLAVENTNLKAQRLSFGEEREAADAFRDALQPLRSSAPDAESWHAAALVETAVAAVRQIESLQAPHIAESDDAAMTRQEAAMAEAESVARSELQALAALFPAPAPPQLALATAALDRFAGLNATIVALSRRNTNAQSLALSLGRKRTLLAGCEDSLRTLHDALGTRSLGSTR